MISTYRREGSRIPPTKYSLLKDNCNYNCNISCICKNLNNRSFFDVLLLTGELNKIATESKISNNNR